MPHSTAAAAVLPSGLFALQVVLHFHHQSSDAKSLLEQFSTDGQDLSLDDMQLAARSLGFKTRAVRVDWQSLQALSLPVVAQNPDGHCFVITACDEVKVQITDPLEKKPLILPRELFEKQFTGEVLLFKQKLKFKSVEHQQRRFDIRWFVPAITKHRKLFLEILLASLVVQLIALATPLMFQVIVDKVLVHQGISTLTVIGIGMLGIAVFEVLLTFLRNQLTTHTSSRIDVLLGARLFRHLISLPLSYFEARRVGDSVARVRELDTIRQFITGSTITLTIDLLFTLVFFAVLFIYSPLLTAIVALSIPVYIVLSVAVTPQLRSKLNKRFNSGAENQAFLVESVSGIKTVKSMSLKSRWEKRWGELLAHYIKNSYDASQLGNLMTQAAGLINKVTMALVLWTGAYLVMAQTLTIGQLIAFNMIAMRISSPVLKLVQLWQDFLQAGLSIARLGDILNQPAETSGNHHQRLQKISGQIEFEQVSFAYADSRVKRIKNLSLKILPGEIIGIAGESGSGKSTLAKLLQRLYLPSDGKVKIDGYDIASLNLEDLRKQVAVVSQESFLFNMSVKDNICLGNAAASMEQVIECAKIAGAHDFIQAMTDGYETQIEEQGVNLSGGQRQRLAIARALLSDSRILVLDEATSALDYESESIIQQHMRMICRNRTVIIIAHRLNTLSIAHRIVCLREGEIIEQGTQQQLLAKSGYFAKLNALQQNGTFFRKSS